jgi:integrase
MFTIKNVTSATPGRHQAGEVGLFLEVSKDGKSRRWLFRYVSPATFRPTEAGLGGFPLVGLAAARAKAMRMRQLVADGTDPIQQKREARATALAEHKAAVTFGAALTAYGEAFADKGAVTVDTVARVTRHVAPLLGRSLQSITTDDVLTALGSVQATHPKEAARVRNHVAVIFDYATARGLYAGANPASRAVFKFLVPAPPPAVPFRMMPVDDVPACYASLSDNPSPSRLCLRFLILTAARSQEAIRVEWSDIDIGQRLWVVPADKIKKRRVHKVPLSDAALAVLEQAARLFGDDGYVFPGAISGKPLAPRILEGVMRLQLRQPYSVHGLRAAFSTHAHERTDFAHELIELALAHVEGHGNAVARAYNRSDAIERRRALMDVWGRYVTGETPATNVVPWVKRA